MEAVAIVLAVAVVLTLAWFAGSRLMDRSRERRVQREKLESVASGHREMAAAHESSVDRLEPEVEAHREAAAEHARAADELEERIERERRQARFHEQRASETEGERERI
jgi:outer membrane murein-binding lipoprotein Lpp